jgi:hypothetical protein
VKEGVAPRSILITFVRQRNRRVIANVRWSDDFDIPIVRQREASLRQVFSTIRNEIQTEMGKDASRPTRPRGGRKNFDGG